MKSIFFLLLIMSYSFGSIAQIKALTETGDEVMLYQNGTWKYTKEKSKDASEADSAIAFNKTSFSKSKTATFAVKSKIMNVAVNINPDEWGFSKGGINEPIEYMFRGKNKDCFAMFIAEKTEIALTTMPQVVMINAQKKAPDAVILKKEYRMVNGVKVLCIEFAGTSSGIKFKWLGYYYSNKYGTVQLVAFSSQNLFDENYKALEEFLNGLVVLSETAGPTP